MTCYQRHMGWLFEAVAAPNDKEHRREVHRAIVQLVELPEDAHCPEVWSALKGKYGIDARTRSVELAADVAELIGQPGGAG
jgi:hypothetical protein